MIGPTQPPILTAGTKAERILKRRVAGLILEGMARLVGRHADRRQIGSAVDIGAEPQHLAAWIIVVREKSADPFDRHMLQPIGVQHFARRLRAVDAGAGRHARILLERPADTSLRPQAQDHGRQCKDKIEWIEVEHLVFSSYNGSG